MKERTLSVLALRAQLAAYYREGPLRRTLERLTEVTFDESVKMFSPQIIGVDMMIW